MICSFPKVQYGSFVWILEPSGCARVTRHHNCRCGCLPLRANHVACRACGRESNYLDYSMIDYYHNTNTIYTEIQLNGCSRPTAIPRGFLRGLITRVWLHSHHTPLYSGRGHLSLDWRRLISSLMIYLSLPHPSRYSWAPLFSTSRRHHRTHSRIRSIDISRCGLLTV